jgi:predicted nucleotidyltransferase
MSTHDQHILDLIKSTIHEKDAEAEVILFGSRARGQENKQSDWDILILLNTNEVNRETEKEYREALFEVALETGEAISTFVFSKQEWESKHLLSPLFQNIQKEGIYL